MPRSARPSLNALQVFAAVAQAGGFTAAAERLGMTKANVSLAVARLEAQLGATLLARTTRRVTLTDAGQALYLDSEPLLRGLEDTLARAGEAQAELGGTLRIAASVDHAALSLAPAVAAFAALHPRLAIDLRASDHVADLVKEGVDLAIRTGWLRDSSLRAVKLGEFEQYVLAAPAYLRRAGRPKKPVELAAHDWIALTLLRTPLTWKFTSKAGATHTVRMQSRLRADSNGALRALVQAGAGVSAFSSLSAAAAMRSGSLERLLPEWSLPRGGIYAVYPPGRHMPATVRAFVAFYREQLARDLA